MAGAGRASLCVDAALGLVLLGRFDGGLPLGGAEHGRGDRQHAVHEREPHLMVPFAAFGGERQGGEDPFRLDEVRSCGDGLVWDG